MYMNFRMFIKIILVFTVCALIFSGCSADVKDKTSDISQTLTENKTNLSTVSTDDISSSEHTYETENDEPIHESVTQTVTPPPAVQLQYPAAIMYHLILDEPYSSETELFVTPEVFDETVRDICEKGYTFLFADEYEKREEKSVVLTFDDGYEDNYQNMFPILKKYGAKATVFLITDLIGSAGYLTEAEISEMSKSGLVRFGSHTVSHCNIAETDTENVRDELSKSKLIIENLTGCPCRAFAYPGGKYTSDITKVVSEYYEYAYTTKSPNSVREYSHMNIPRHYGARSLSSKRILEMIERCS